MKNGEFLPQTTSNLRIRHKYPLTTTHGTWGGEPPVSAGELHPSAAPTSLSCSTSPSKPPCCRKRRSQKASRRMCDHSLAEAGGALQEQSLGTILRSAPREASARAWPARRNPMFRMAFSCPYKQPNHNSPIPGSEASFKCWSVEAHN